MAAGYWLGDTYGRTVTVSTWLNNLVYAAFVLLLVWFVVSRLVDRFRNTTA